jgi:hypothetical protein
LKDDRTPAAKKANYVGARPKDESTLSRDPKQVRNRIRRKHKKWQNDVDIYINEIYQKPITEWDVEELAHGRPRSKNGSFQGKVPRWITPAVQQEAKRRLLHQTFGSLAGHMTSAVKCIGQLITSTEVDDNGKPLVDARTKLAASIFVIENIMGKPKAVVEVNGADLVQQALAAAIILDDGGEQDEQIVLDGEWEETDQEDDAEIEEDDDE